VRALLLPILLAATAAGQWRHFDDHQPAASSFAREMLDAHNALRRRAGTPALVWSERMAAQARDWADTLLARGQFAHRPNPKYGENLYEISGAPATPVEVVSDWASEARDYDYRSNRCRDVCGHYTQIIWASTREVGCAVARGGGREVWVCNYDPPGNWVGERPY
jgi:uncharacterized protein YkwD